MAIKRPSQCDVGNGLEKTAGNTAVSGLWASAVGRQTLDIENAALAPFIRRLHGDVIVWAGTHSDSAKQLERCMVRHSIFLQQQPACGGAEMPSMAACLEALPFKTNALDAVVLHHALENTVDPRVALREVTRVLMPGGRLLIAGFNPLSLMGLRRLYGRFATDALSDQRLVNPLRLFDWLTLLGYELDVAPVYCGYSLPFDRLVQRIDVPDVQRQDFTEHRRSNLPFGGLLIVSAVKQALPMRMQRSPKQSRHALEPVAYPRVSSWQRLKP